MRKFLIGIVAVIFFLGCVQEHPCSEGTVLVTFTFLDSPDKVDGVALSYGLDDWPVMDLKLVGRPPGTNQGRLALEVQNYKTRKQLLLRYAASKGSIQVGPWLDMRVDLGPSCSTMNVSLASAASDGGVDDAPVPLTDTLYPMNDSGLDLVMDTFGSDRISDATLVQDLPDAPNASVDQAPDLLPADTRILDADVKTPSQDSFPDLNSPSDTIPDSPQTCPNGAHQDYGQPCNSCGGTIQCDGSCKPGEDKNFGTSCGSCGGTITCDGTCNITTPSDYGTKCNNCGGTIQCDDSCKPGEDKNFGTSCGSCGGTITCDGTCNKTTPSDYGTKCNNCGGTIQCDRSCSPKQPLGYGNPCNCTGTIACDGSCTVAAAPDYNTDPNHCGGCGKACSNNHATPACTGGECTSMCSSSFSYADCNADLRNDGCETEISSDPKNCGQCGKICLVTQNQDGRCGNQTKGVDCIPCNDSKNPSGRLNCDLDPSNGCETESFSDENNCGGCGNVCPAGYACLRPGTCFNFNRPDASVSD